MDYTARAGARLKHLIAAAHEPSDPGGRGRMARLAEALGTDAAHAGRLARGERMPGLDTIGHAVSRFGVSADYFFDPGPGDMPHDAYARSTAREIGADLQIAMMASGLTQDQRDAVAGIDWSKLPPGGATYNAVFAGIKYACEIAASQVGTRNAPAMLDAQRAAARVRDSQPPPRRRAR